MPNHVKNIVKMKGITTLPVFTEKESYDKKMVMSLDFEKIIPMPESLRITSGTMERVAVEAAIRKAAAAAKQPFGPRIVPAMADSEYKSALNRCNETESELCELGAQYIHNLIFHGATTWYDWCIEHWGTKWNSYENTQVDSNTITFETAWNAPVPVIAQLAKMHPEAEIEHWWADEDTGSNDGYAKYSGGAIMNMATTGYITITKDDYGSDTLYISNVRDYTKADKLWKWNMNGLGYSNDGGKTFGLAITMDGSIVADYITAGVLNGDLIRAGMIQDVKKNNYWNLETGEFRLSAYAKVGDSTVASKDDVDDLDDSFNQQKVFNRLTNNGQAQGIYLTNKKLYINAEYIATGVLQDSKSNVVFDLNNGKLTIKKGSINIGNNNFIVDEEGNLTARRGTFAGTLVAAKGTFGGQLTAATGDFKGVVQAEDFLDRYGNSMMKGTKFSSNYLDLYGITITNPYTGSVTFKVDGTTGAVTINGAVTMGAGSSINWATVTNVNLGYNPAYTLASSANTNANQAKSDAADAYDEASAAWSRANQAYYDRCTDENVFNVLTNGGTRFGIFSDSYYGRLYINANYIRSGTINADYVDLSCGYGGFCKGHGNDGERTTYGAMMYGSNGPGWEPYIIVTNAGARMTGSGASIWVGMGVNATDEISIRSDARVKNSINYTLDVYDEFFMALKPTQFKYNDGTSGRLHLGFIAQDVEQAIDTFSRRMRTPSSASTSCPEYRIPLDGVS